MWYKYRIPNLEILLQFVFALRWCRHRHTYIHTEQLLKMRFSDSGVLKTCKIHQNLHFEIFTSNQYFFYHAWKVKFCIRYSCTYSRRINRIVRWLRKMKSLQCDNIINISISQLPYISSFNSFTFSCIF